MGDSSLDRTRRALAEALDGARPRTADDAHDPTVPVAATVVVARDSRDGVEVLLIERPDRGSFAGAWVFPGGKLEPVDEVAGDTEEGVARRAGARETLEETGLRVDDGALVTLSVWDPPPGIPLRIRTWFFVTADPAGEVSLSVDEATRAEWMRPVEALARHGRGEIMLYPPTWVTLNALSSSGSVSGLLETTRLNGTQGFETVMRPTPAGAVFLWAGDAEYNADEQQGASEARHRLETGALPWRYVLTREDEKPDSA